MDLLNITNSTQSFAVTNKKYIVSWEGKQKYVLGASATWWVLIRVNELLTYWMD